MAMSQVKQLTHPHQFVLQAGLLVAFWVQGRYEFVNSNLVQVIGGFGFWPPCPALFTISLDIYYKNIIDKTPVAQLVLSVDQSKSELEGLIPPWLI